MHAVRVHEPLLPSSVEERAMRDEGLLGDRSRVGWPCVQVRVKVDDGDGSINFVQRA